MAEALDETGLIGGAEVVAPGEHVGVTQKFGAEGLRSLRQNNSFPRNCGGDERNVTGNAGALHFLHGVQRGNADDCGSVFAHIDAEAPLPKPLPTDEAALKRLYAVRNEKFYAFVKSRLPRSEILKAMREPGSI